MARVACLITTESGVCLCVCVCEWGGAGGALFFSCGGVASDFVNVFVLTLFFFCDRYNGLLEGVPATVMEYALEVRLSTGESWKVSHRYSAFSGLYEEILRTKGGRGTGGHHGCPTLLFLPRIHARCFPPYA